MYSQIKLCVRGFSNETSENCIDNAQECNNNDTFFCSKAGVFQGESLSPFLFAMFLNDINDKISTAKDVGITIENCLLSIILFADDMAIFSLSRSGLQNGLNCLKDYCDGWGLVVNVDKTKCVAFKKGGKIAALDKWKYNGNEIETVNQFKYLGFVLSSSGTFNKGIDALLGKAQRALFSLKTVFHENPEMS